MWGICFDTTTSGVMGELFQRIAQYEIVDGKAVVILPEAKAGYEIDINDVRELPEPPRFAYGVQVSPYNHPDVIGAIEMIGWHFKYDRCFYFININGKTKSRWYFDDELLPREQKERDVI